MAALLARTVARSLAPTSIRAMSTETAQPLFVRKAAPTFTAEALVGSEFKQLSLKDYLGKYVVLFFYPLDLYVHGGRQLEGKGEEGREGKGS